jgi:hypothetical protein
VEERGDYQIRDDGHVPTPAEVFATLVLGRVHCFAKCPTPTPSHSSRSLPQSAAMTVAPNDPAPQNNIFLNLQPPARDGQMDPGNACATLDLLQPPQPGSRKPAA